LLFALGLKGGVALTHAHFGEILLPILVTLFLGILTPLSAYMVLRRWGKFSIADAAGIAAHYGSVSAVTFIAAQQFCTGLREPVEGIFTDAADGSGMSRNRRRLGRRSAAVGSCDPSGDGDGHARRRIRSNRAGHVRGE